MSRSGYSTDLDDWDLIRWRGQVASAIRGKRGQKFLVDLLAALDALPQKSLIVDELQEEGQVCAIGALGLSRGLDMSKIDPEDADQVAAAFNISPCLAQEIEFENDEYSRNESQEERWQRMRNWIASKISGKIVLVNREGTAAE